MFEPINIRSEKYRDVYQGKGITWKTVVRKKAIFIGKRFKTTMQNDQSYHDIPQIWSKAVETNLFEKIPNPQNPNVMNGIYTGWDIDENFDLLIGTFVHQDTEPPQGFIHHSVAEGKYMVFSIFGNTTEKVLLGWKYIYGTWFAENSYEHGDADDFDHFDERFFEPSQPCSDIFISIK